MIGRSRSSPFCCSDKSLLLSSDFWKEIDEKDRMGQAGLGSKG